MEPWPWEGQEDHPALLWLPCQGCPLEEPRGAVWGVQGPSEDDCPGPGFALLRRWVHQAPEPLPFLSWTGQGREALTVLGELARCSPDLECGSLLPAVLSSLGAVTSPPHCSGPASVYQPPTCTQGPRDRADEPQHGLACQAGLAPCRVVGSHSWEGLLLGPSPRVFPLLGHEAHVPTALNCPCPSQPPVSTPHRLALALDNSSLLEAKCQLQQLPVGPSR